MAYPWLVSLAGVPVCYPTVSSRNREPLLGQDLARLFSQQIRGVISEGGMAGNEHFSVDGTHLEAWASLKTCRVQDEVGSEKTDDDRENPTVDFKG